MDGPRDGMAADMKIGGRSTTAGAAAIAEAVPDRTTGGERKSGENKAGDTYREDFNDGGDVGIEEYGGGDGDDIQASEPVIENPGGNENAIDGSAGSGGTGNGEADYTGTAKNGGVHTENIFSASGFDGLSAKKIGWGVKLNGNKQPEVSTAILDVLDKYDAAFVGNPEVPLIYLTFDLGYETGYTVPILDTLKDEGVRAAFFIDGHYLSSQPDVVNRIINDGHIAANHSLRHKSFPDLTDEELAGEILGLESVFSDATGAELSKYVRPPSGEYSERSLAVTASLGRATVFWSFAYVDYDPQQSYTADYAYDKITDNIHNGAVILLHTVKKENADVLGRVIKKARGDGYAFDTLDNLFLYITNTQNADPGGQDNVPNYT